MRPAGSGLAAAAPAHIAAAFTVAVLTLACARGDGAPEPRRAGAAIDAHRPPMAARTGPPAPALELQDVGGTRVRLDDYHGRPVLINFWATWCEPCRLEMPSLVRLHAKLAGRGLEILAVSIDADRGAVLSYLGRSPLPFRVLLDADKAAYGRYGVSVIPATFIVDREGRVVERIDGASDWTNPKLVGMIEGILEVGRGTSSPALGRAS